MNKDVHTNHYSKPKSRAGWLVASALFLVAALLCVFVIYPVMYNPNALFDNTIPSPSNSSKPAPTPTPLPVQDGELNNPEPKPTPEPDYLEELGKMADFSSMKNIFNILLIGVDYAEERVENRKEYVDKNFNSDVMMLMAVNFDEQKVDLISVPRDTYAKIANAEGKYKLNFSLTLGGGIGEEGFMNVCKSVEWVLGGVPVNYYIAVTMPMLKEVVDLIGGVDYDIDVAFKIQGRNYKKGMQHLDGQGVLDYCRARKHMAQSGDANRINRQKKMMLTVYDTIRKNTALKDVPTMIQVLSENVYTNLDFSQLAALAYFGNGLDLENVHMESFTGTGCMIFNYGYVCTDQNKRVKLIKDIYGVDVPKENEYSASYARLEWAKWQARVLVPRVRSAIKKQGGDEGLLAAVNNLDSVRSSSNYQEINDAIDHLKDAVAASGLKVSMRVDVYTEGQVPMKE